MVVRNQNYFCYFLQLCQYPCVKVVGGFDFIMCIFSAIALWVIGGIIGLSACILIYKSIQQDVKNNVDGNSNKKKKKRNLHDQDDDLTCEMCQYCSFGLYACICGCCSSDDD